MKRRLRTFAESHRVSDERLTAATLVLFLLAADVVESEEQVMSLGQTCRQSQFHLFVEVRRPAQNNRGGGTARREEEKIRTRQRYEPNWVSYRFRKTDLGLVYSLVVVGHRSVDFLEELRATRFPKNDLKTVNRGDVYLANLLFDNAISSPNKDKNAPPILSHLMNNKVYYSSSILVSFIYISNIKAELGVYSHVLPSLHPLIMKYRQRELKVSRNFNSQFKAEAVMYKSSKQTRNSLLDDEWQPNSQAGSRRGPLRSWTGFWWWCFLPTSACWQSLASGGKQRAGSCTQTRREGHGRQISIERGWSKASSTTLQHKVALPTLNPSSCIAEDDGNISENTKQTVHDTRLKTTPGNWGYRYIGKTLLNRERQNAVRERLVHKWTMVMLIWWGNIIDYRCEKKIGSVFKSSAVCVFPKCDSLWE